MDSNVVTNKIDSLIRCINRIEEKKPENINVLESDYDLQDILILNLERAVQNCVDIGSHILSDYNYPAPKTMAEVFKQLSEIGLINKELSANLRASVGFRNIAVHEYQTIDWNIVYSITTKHIKDFKKFVSIVDKLL